MSSGQFGPSDLNGDAGALVTIWREFSADRCPYALEPDLEVLGSSKRYAVTFSSYEAYLESGLEIPSDQRFHLGLLPQPWSGDLNAATVFVLMLNPGLNPGDYFAEYRVPDYRRALVRNLRHESDRPYPLLFLDPEFSWHSGARYFRSRLHWLVLALAKRQSLSYREALASLARRVCILQLVPYHSAVFRLSRRMLNRLESTALAKAFVHEHLLSRNGVLILVTRRAGDWDLSSRENVIAFERSETRAAYLSPSTRGGQALARHFGLSML